MTNDRTNIRDEVVPVLRKARAVISTKVVVVLERADGTKETHESTNIVTNAGDLFYAERGVNTAIPSNFVDGSGDFDGIMELYNGASAAPAKDNDRSDMAGLVTGSAKVIDATYPQVNDGDSDNTGAGADIITYRTSYLTSEANDTGIADVIITNPSPGASEPLLMHAEFGAPFDKTSSDTLKVFINHQMNGV